MDGGVRPGGSLLSRDYGGSPAEAKMQGLAHATLVAASLPIQVLQAAVGLPSGYVLVREDQVPLPLAIWFDGQPNN